MLKRFFHHCSGADLTLLESSDCRTDHAKFVGVGTAVFFTAVFAVVSSSYALYYVFETWWVILIGFIWGLFIFSLDRYIVSTMRKGIGAGREWGLAAPRVVIALFLALIISKPLELKVFEKEISNKLVDLDVLEQTSLAAAVTKKDAYRRATLLNEIATLDTELSAARNRRDAQQLREANELNGSGGSKHYGDGPAHRLELAVLQKAEQELAAITAKNQPLLDAKSAELKALTATTQQNIVQRQKQRKRNDGLLGRIAALGLLTSADASADRAGLALLLFFILIETAPVLVKLLSSAGPYDFKLNAVEKQVEAQEIQRVSQANEEVNRSLQITLGENEQVVIAQLEGNKELLNRLNAAQLDIAQEMIDQWKTGELQKLRRPEPPI